jgi:carbon storage regulator
VNLVFSHILKFGVGADPRVCPFENLFFYWAMMEKRRSKMLILTRRINESIVIGDDIMVIVRAIQGKQVSIGIIAPKNITIHREEIYAKIQAKLSDDDHLFD